MCEETKYPIQFLWDKWKYHDSLVYSRQTSSMVLQVSIITGTILALRAVDPKYISNINAFIFFGLFLAWSISAFSTWVFIKSQEIDLRVRNAFNKCIVEELIRLGIVNKTDKWQLDSYDAENNKHPVNLWHTPYPYEEGNKTRATKWNRYLMVSFFWINILAAFSFLVSFFCAIPK